MKRKAVVAGSAILLVALAVGAWFYAYYHRKSNDNLPSLASIAQMEEADVNNLLIGYHREQLLEVWGEPDQRKSNEDIWIINGSTGLLVNSDNKGKVVICGLKYILLPEEITGIEVNGYYNGGVINPGDFVIKDFEIFRDWFAKLSLEHREFAKGESPGETLAGGDAYEFDMNNGELCFTYVDHGVAAYMIYNEEWYQVENPSDPPFAGETISFHDKTFHKEDLSQKTIAWLERYNALTEEEQLSISAIPADLYQLCGYDAAKDMAAE